MVVNNWIAANLIWITLAIAIVVLIYLVFTIIQTIRKKRRFVSQLNIILLILGLMFLIFLTYRASEIEGADWGQIILMIGLVAITAAYASSAEKQANASVKMAEAMRNQRYDTVRPVIDFKLQELYPVTTKEGLTIEEREKADLAIFPGCKLHNIGIGSATDVYSFTLTVGGERRQLYLGSLVKGATTEEAILSTEQRGDCWFLVAYYRDAYGQSFESSREVHLDVETGKPLLGPLRIIPVKEVSQND